MKPSKQSAKIARLRKKADKLFYQVVMAKNNGICEVCGAMASTAHHFVFKSQSAELRYDTRNGIPICLKCHFRIHSLGDAEIVNNIIRKRGQKWADELFKVKNHFVKKYRGVEYYEGIIDKLQKMI